MSRYLNILILNTFLFIFDKYIFIQTHTLSHGLSSVSGISTITQMSHKHPILRVRYPIKKRRKVTYMTRYEIVTTLQQKSRLRRKCGLARLLN